MAAVKFSNTPSWKNLTSSQFSRPTLPPWRRTISSSSWPMSPVGSQPSMARTRIVRSPLDDEAGVRLLRLRVDQRVGPRRDAERVVVRLRGADAVDAIGERRLRGDGEDELHRLLLQHARGAARRVALDAAAVGVGRRVGDAGDLERAAVDPHAVVVAVRQRHGAVRHDGVELVAGGEAAREVAHDQPPPSTQSRSGCRRRVLADRRHGLLAPGDVVQVALRHAVAGRGRVAVGVDEAGQQHAALQVDLARRRAAVRHRLHGCRRRRRCGRRRRPPPTPAGGRR